MEILEAYESWQNKVMLMQTAWHLLTKIGAQKENEIHCERIIKLLTENLEHLKISKFYDKIFLFLVLKKFNYKRIFFIRAKIQELFFFILKIFS
jgi:two-component sensor histidine kinase